MLVLNFELNALLVYRRVFWGLPSRSSTRSGRREWLVEDRALVEITLAVAVVKEERTSVVCDMRDSQ